MLATAAGLGLLLAATAADLRAQPAASSVPGHPGLALYTQSWAVVVGVDRFRDRGISRLQYAANDARAVALALKGLGFPAENITLLLDERATRAEVERVLSVVEELGHGVFTRKLLDGLAGHAEENRDGIVTVGELAAWMHPRVAQASDYKQDMQWGTLDGEGQVVFVLPDSARIASGDQTTRLHQEQQRLVEERARVEAERRRLETERSRLETALPPPTAVDPLARGRLLFDLDLKRQPHDVDIAVGNEAFDRVRFTGQAAEVSLRGKTFAAIGIAGREFDDFVAEVRVAPIKGDGYVAVQSRVGTTAYYAVRVLPFAGTLSITRAPRGRHDIRDETQLSAPFLRMPIVRPGAEIVFTVVQRGPDLVVYLDGAEAARASDASLARGRVELAFGTLADSFQVQVRSFRVWALSGR